MVYTYLDIETTGLSIVHDAPIQFAYLQMQGNGIFLRRNAFYINTSCNSWSAGAEEVHHISRDMLKAYGVEEIRAIASINAILRQANLVTYNGNHFDIPMIIHRIQEMNIPCVINENGFDVMMEWQKFYGGKRKKLAECIAECGYTQSYIAQVVRMLYGEDGNFFPHDARYDVVETMLLHRRLLKDMAEAEAKKAVIAPKEEPQPADSPVTRLEV